VSAPDPSFEEYVAARMPALLRTAYLLTGHHQDAEDLVQAALVKVVPHWRKVADKPDPYVHKVLANEHVSRWRRRRWREVHAEVVPDRGTLDPDVGDREALRGALLQLAPRQRAVVVLRYYEDLTEREVASVLGISVGTVKSQARDGLARLRRVMPQLDQEAVPELRP
jgi:RNA polymerase sigma-70 factor (sigma-E family)